MRLTPEVTLVGSGDSGFGLTDAYDCHVYLLDGGDEAALVDTGIGAGVDTILANGEAAGCPRERIRSVFLTHGHADHAGGAERVRELLPRARVFASVAVADWVRRGDEEGLGVAIGKRPEFYPPDYRFTACPVEGELGDGDEVRVGSLVVRAIETPGHADGHLAFAVDGRAGRMLFSGDLVFFGGRISLASRRDCRLDAYATSLGKLRDAGVEALLPGHHAISLANGQRHIDASNRLFDRGFVPKSVV